ncbi:unnamed protein product [Taenia asiatica]|uniref:Uncharacterized protein n=1 Tax=Taenia asiatica TaxID=60517 RepID=A0A3P6NJ66_TAEAS|nr:unnamed protein product [Taenia asiatica]
MDDMFIQDDAFNDIDLEERLLIQGNSWTDSVCNEELEDM